MLQQLRYGGGLKMLSFAKKFYDKKYTVIAVRNDERFT